MKVKGRVKRKPFREGDYVILLNPRRFIRCGYPYTFEMAYEELEKRDSEIESFIKDMGFAEDSHTVYKIRSALAYNLVRKKGFGGKERRCYFEPFDEGYRKIFRVRHTQRVVEGDYYPPGGSYDSYECGGLMKPRHRQIVHCYGHGLINSKKTGFGPFSTFTGASFASEDIIHYNDYVDIMERFDGKEKETETPT